MTDIRFPSPPLLFSPLFTSHQSLSLSLSLFLKGEEVILSDSLRYRIALPSLLASSSKSVGLLVSSSYSISSHLGAVPVLLAWWSDNFLFSDQKSYPILSLSQEGGPTYPPGSTSPIPGSSPSSSSPRSYPILSWILYFYYLLSPPGFLS